MGILGFGLVPLVCVEPPLVTLRVFYALVCLLIDILFYLVQTARFYGVQKRRYSKCAYIHTYAFYQPHWGFSSDFLLKLYKSHNVNASTPLGLDV